MARPKEIPPQSRRREIPRVIKAAAQTIRLKIPGKKEVVQVLIAIAVILAIITAIFLAVLAGLAHQMQPRPAPDLRSAPLGGTRFEEYEPTVRSDAARADALPWEDVYISSYDGLRLHGRVLRGSPGADTIVLVHGYRSSMANDFAGVAGWYAERGYTLVAADQRAHGGSEGRVIRFGERERRDAVAWTQYAGYVLGAERVWVHGVSMGAVSALLALEEGFPDCVRGVIADCPFDSAMGLFAFHVRKRFRLPPFPVVTIGSLAWRLLLGGHFVRTSCHEAAAGSDIPLLLISAGEDATVPPGSARAVWEARGRRDTLDEFPHAHHALCWQEDREKYAAALQAFLGAGE